MKFFIMNVLIIEDEKKIAQLLKIWLDKIGYTATYVTDGESGEARVEARPEYYDLILLDLMLPGKSGFEVCRALRKRNIRTPILIVSSKSDTNAKEMAFDLGATDYLTKPFSFGSLLEKIKNITDGRGNIES